MQEEEFLHFENERYVYEQYERYQKDPYVLPIEWIRFFQGMELSFSKEITVKDKSLLDKDRIVSYLKEKGHLFAQTNSIEGKKECTIETIFEKLSVDQRELPSEFLQSIESVKNIYCGKVGLEFFEDEDVEKRVFFETAMKQRGEISNLHLISALKEVGKAKLLEEFLHKKFLGAKRFSIEGGESVIALLKVLIDQAADLGCTEGYIGMAHRGRVNTLCHILEKPYHEVFSEFDPHIFPQEEGLGDVKYHKGYQKKVKTLSGKTIDLHMAANPSHLEAVDGVVLGMKRARLDEGLYKAVSVVIHGDASIAGQGVVYETLQFNKLEGYQNKGTIHIIIDNHVGFTALPKESRSTYYPSDIAKAFLIPILHVDASEIKEVISVAKIAMQYNNQFNSDIFIHYNCYRLYGHNEADEPNFTNPVLYKKLSLMRDHYSELKKEFIEKKLVTEGEMDLFEKELKGHFISELEKKSPSGDLPFEDYLSFDQEVEGEYLAYEEMDTFISEEVFDRVKKAITKIPEHFNLHKKVHKLVEQRAIALEQEDNPLIDWGIAEMMAYGSLLLEGKSVRLSGQDCRRGTFSHRHAVYVDQEDEDHLFNPLDELKKGGFTVFNSPLSEYGVMAFEYGYSVVSSHGVVIWEAQFGDFYNGATIIVDQFLSSTKSKWGVESSLILYLPNGNEGMGQEHTSGRIERFLQLAARKNLRIFYPTTPSQIFHLVRSQGLSKEKIPLIVFTPKKDLRNQISKGRDFKEGKLEQVIVKGPLDREKVVFVSGKLALEIEKADTLQRCIIIRIEQLYPFPQKKIKEVLKRCTHAKTFIYAQEEPKNQGAYFFAKEYLEEIIGKKGTLQYVGRKRLESTSTGYVSVHNYHQKKIIEKVLEE